MSSRMPASLLNSLSLRAAAAPNQTAYTILLHGERESSSLSYAELLRRARAVAEVLQERGLRGERALLLYPAGLEFVAAFYGCLLAGTVAVPAALPRPNRGIGRIEGIVADAQASAILTTMDTQPRLAAACAGNPTLAGLTWLTTDKVAEPAHAWREPVTPGDTLAYLQYTSGSTATPKGVMISHGNVAANAAAIQEAFELSADSVSVSWLPHYHDMGLIDGIIVPLIVGFPGVLMPPVAFLQQPVRWLQAISRFRATHSGAPNFAYDMCVRQVSDEELHRLDLSCWLSAYNGAEPVRKETLERFAARFAPCGFRPHFAYPCYGLAEATLMVSGGQLNDPPVFRTVDARMLGQHRVVEVPRDHPDARELVGCGHPQGATQVCIVQPETHNVCAPGEVGEVWVSGLSVAQGYWNRPEEAKATFQAYLDSGEGPFLRTGDLGFVQDGELFITGRLKDLVIIDGSNHYPQDIEQTVAGCHAVLQSVGAAFSIEGAEGESLVIVHELGRHYQDADLDACIEVIRRAVSEEHEIAASAVVLVRAGTVPKTSSGKIQRLACRAAFLDGKLNSVREWRATRQSATESRATMTESRATMDAIAAWLVKKLAELLHIEAAGIDLDRPLVEFGLASRDAVNLSGRLEQWLERRLSPTLVYEYPTIARLARFLAGQAPAPQAAPMVRRTAAGETEPIAVIGMGCRFPGASDPASFWKMLSAGQDAVTPVPAERWDAATYYEANPAALGKMNTRWGGFLEHIDQFDPQFFSISPREAARMDPQQRLVLETAWEALEDAGQTLDQLAGSRTGVFIGASTSDYALMQFADPASADAYAGAGSALSVAANRLSYFLDLRGPSLAVDTACSSSLVAVHLACESLRRGEADLALAGGVNVILAPALTVNFTKAGFMAPDGRCKPFDARADGYVRGEGAGVVVLKPLSRALADGDPIHAVIRGSAVNQNGRGNGLTAPNPGAQESVLREAYNRAGVSPGQVCCIEAHGTGTFLGDPIEAQALGAVFSSQRDRDRRCLLGSVKSNIGHLEAAAGIAGLVKTILILKHRAVPPSLHFEQPNPHIPFDELRLRVPQIRTALPEIGRKLFAGVSSFGFGGTNAHVVLEEAPATVRSGLKVGPPYLLTISARQPKALRDLAQAYRSMLAIEAVDLTDVCYTAGARRSHHEHRLALVGNSCQDMGDLLDAFLRDEKRHHLYAGVVPPRMECVEPTAKNGQETLDALAARYTHGRTPNWNALYPQGGRCVPLPAYPWQRERCWFDTPQKTARSSDVPSDWFYEIAWREKPIQKGFALATRPSPLGRGIGGEGVEPARAVNDSQADPMLDHEALAPRMNKLCDAYVWQALHQLGWKPQSGQSFAIAQRVEQLGITARQQQLFKRMLQMLREDGYLDLSEGRGTVRQIPTLPAPEELRGEILKAAPALAAELSLLHDCGQRLAHVLSGSLDPLEVLFPGGDASAVSAVYRDAPSSRYFNKLAGEVIAEVAERSSARRLRILEIGAGTAGTTRHVLPRLPAGRVEYLFTDVSRLFLDRARAEFGANPDFRCQLFDVEQPWDLQGLAEHSFDIVLAANVLHATADVKLALVTIRRLLAPGSMLVLLEVTGKPRWLDLVFGLTEGWWKFRDFDLRPEHALLSRSQWQTVMAEAGYSDVEAVPERDRLPQSLLLARAQAEAPRLPEKPRTWLLLADRGNVNQEVAQLLRSRGQRVVTLSPGSRFARIGPDHFQVSPEERADFARVLDPTVSGGEYAGIIHLWSLDFPNVQKASLHDLEATQALGCGSIVTLMQAAQGGPRVWVVTRGALAIDTKDAITSPAAAALWGLGRGLAQEVPAQWGGLIDLDPGASAADSARLLLDQIGSADNEDQTAFRNGQRYVARLTPRPAPRVQSTSPVRPDASYLITGGLGGLGLETARWLVDQGARWLILLARGQQASGPDQDKRRASVQEMERLGAKVHLARADVADEAQVRMALEELRRSDWPAIRGVIHAAGVADLRSVLDLDAATLRAVLRPKLVGGYVLERLFADAELDFFVFYSSAAALLGMLAQGQSAYAAANAALDALAQQGRQRGRPLLSINWGIWSEVGRVPAEHIESMRRRGFPPIAPRQGLQALGTLFAEDKAQVVMLPAQWPLVKEAFPAASTAPLLGEVMREVGPARTGSQDTLQRLTRASMLELPAIEHKTRLQGYFVSLAARVLKLPLARLDVQQPLHALGLDSLMAIELKNRTETDFGVTVPVVAWLQGLSIAMLTDYVLKGLAAAGPRPAESPPRHDHHGQNGSEEAGKLLENLEKLSDQEVDSLLASMLSSGREMA